jgi:hypothetical protein
MLHLIILIALCVLPLTVGAQSVSPPMPLITKEGVTVIRPTPYSEVLYDHYGNSAMIYQQGRGLSWYSQHDNTGKIVAQGYLFNPVPRPEPLRVPPIDLYSLHLDQDRR